MLLVLGSLYLRKPNDTDAELFSFAMYLYATLKSKGQ